MCTLIVVCKTNAEGDSGVFTRVFAGKSHQKCAYWLHRVAWSRAFGK